MNSGIKFLSLIFLFIFSITVATCGIPDFEPFIELATPMGLEAEIVSNNIELSFWSLNTEEYFTGFYIYYAEGETEYESETNNPSFPDSYGDTNVPTMWNGIDPVTVATKFTYVITKEPDNDPLLANWDYGLYVKAYSLEKNIYSEKSEFITIKYIPE